MFDPGGGNVKDLVMDFFTMEVAMLNNEGLAMAKFLIYCLICCVKRDYYNVVLFNLSGFKLDTCCLVEFASIFCFYFVKEYNSQD